MAKHSLYQRYETLSPIYQGGLTNHLPMVLVVLQKVGIDDDEIIKILDNYKDVRGIFDLTGTSTPVNDFEQEYINRTGFYLHKCDRSLTDIVVGTFLNENIKAVSSGLYHGLIRLKYALDSKEDIQIAQALAYFELIATDIETYTNKVPLDLLEKSFEDLRMVVETKDITFELPGTSNKITQMMEYDEIRNKLFTVDYHEINKERLLNLFLVRYLETRDFYVLHVITGFHALLSLEQYFVDFKEVLQEYLTSAIPYLLLNPKQEKYDINSPRTFAELLQNIGKMSDFHDIKLLYSLHELNHEFSNEKLLIIANLLCEKYYK